jgi:Domain of unknown function (DUF4167)
MQNGPNTMGPRHRRPAAFGTRPKSGPARTTHPSSQSAQRSYEKYLALARAEAQAGNPVDAENYYQHAEHFFRAMRSARENGIAPNPGHRAKDDPHLAV